MTFQLDFATIASGLAIIIGIGSLLDRKIKEGERREAIKQMGERILKLETRQDKIDCDNNDNGKLLVRIDATLESLAKAFEIVRGSLEQHISDTARK